MENIQELGVDIDWQNELEDCAYSGGLWDGVSHECTQVDLSLFDDVEESIADFGNDFWWNNQESEEEEGLGPQLSDCYHAGGLWDTENNACVLSEPEEESIAWGVTQSECVQAGFFWDWDSQSCKTLEQMMAAA